ncbi:MAG: TetR/AcrR family transcriptional regulator [Bifidobacterium breve]|nr:TetR/AcrR family transcriptional regulator [Bifidobacterium breve]
MNNEKKTTPRHRPETEERRQSIIEAAADVFGSKGTANGTLQEVADRVGMTRAGSCITSDQNEDCWKRCSGTGTPAKSPNSTRGICPGGRRRSATWWRPQS